MIKLQFFSLLLFPILRLTSDTNAQVETSKMNSSNILFFLGFVSHSHRVTFQPLATKLADLGHKVTFLSPIGPAVPDDRIKEFCPTELRRVYDLVADQASSEALEGRSRDKFFNNIIHDLGQPLWDECFEICEAIFKSPDFPSWVEKSKFDLVIVDHPLKECGFALVHKFKSKSISFSAFPPIMSDMDFYGLPTESWLPDWSEGSPYGFIPSRFYYAINSILWYLSYTYTYLPRMDHMVREAIELKGMPPLDQMIRNAGVHFVGQHFSTDYGRSWPPFFVPVGGLHAHHSKEQLPSNIQNFIEDKTSNEFIYISFGSIIKISELPPDKMSVFFETMTNLSGLKFLLKWEGKIPEKLPKNVLALNWFPQQDILAHPLCKGFVSQGGAISYQQAVFHGVPLVILPVWADQSFVARIAVRKENGIHLELVDLTVESLTSAIKELLSNPSYKENAKIVSEQFKDRPMSALDTALWWTLYVLRHNNTNHLKSLGVSQFWWERRMLDLWAIIISILLLCSVSLFYVVILICRRFKRDSKCELRKEKKSKLKSS